MDAPAGLAGNAAPGSTQRAGSLAEGGAGIHPPDVAGRHLYAAPCASGQPVFAGRVGRAGTRADTARGMVRRRTERIPAAPARVRSFGPIVGPASRALVLGSIPGQASLHAGQYYAHPQNAFWPIVGALTGVAPGSSYERRREALVAAGLAVWDVFAACARRGSLDADIDGATIETNDFAAFFAAWPAIDAVFCNGGTAYTGYRLRVVPRLDGRAAHLPVVQLPSTSPAHAAMPRPEKQRRWRRALAPYCARRP